MMQQHPRVPWVTYKPLPAGGFEVFDTRTGDTAYAAEASGIESFAADHSAAQGHAGLGDMVALFAKPIAGALGMDPGCTPCAQKQQALNLLFPHLYRT
jgi:hypothetical protein